ncbi:MAG: hypothetical protein U0232_01685 [Thermomicrobiales bacterium]
MPTLADIRARPRRMLEDTDPVAPLWSDIELNEWLAQCRRARHGRASRAKPPPRSSPSTARPTTPPTDARRAPPTPAGHPIPRRAPHQPRGGRGAKLGALRRRDQPSATRRPPRSSSPIAAFYPFPANDAATFDLPDEGLDLAIAGATLALERRGIAAAKRRGGSAEAPRPHRRPPALRR